MRGSDDAEAMLADNGYGDLPPEMFGQALSSYADTAPMAEADALSPVLTTLDAGGSSDVFSLLQEQPLTLDASGGGSGLGASLLGASALDDALDDDASFDADDLDDIDDFGTAAPDDETDTTADEASETADADDPSFDEDVDQPEAADAEANDPFAENELFGESADDVADSATEFEELEDFFDTEPVATGEDPSDLDF